MDAKGLFLERFRGFQDYVPELLDGLTEEQIRSAPNNALNPIAWLLWHIARCEDLGVNRLAVDGTQVLDDGWGERMDVTLREIGTGMTKAEVQDLSDRVVVSELVEYRNAVAKRTESVVASLPSGTWDDKLTLDTLERVFLEEDGVGPRGGWITDPYAEQTKGWLLGHIALTHSFYHIGQAFSVRVLHGLANPW